LRFGRFGSLLSHFSLASIQEGRRDENNDAKFVRRPMPRYQSKTYYKALEQTYGRTDQGSQDGPARFSLVRAISRLRSWILHWRRRERAGGD